MNPEDFKAVKVLGTGKYSVVYEVVCTKDGTYKDRRYAMKRYFLSNPSAIASALEERKHAASLVSGNPPSPFVATLFWAFGGWETPCCVYNLGSDYNLNDLATSVGLLKEEAARFYVGEILCGLEYIHALDIVHRDIKPRNVLLSHTGHAIITDFNLAYSLREDSKENDKPIYAGTLEFMAPEIANRVTVTKKADVWSLGALMGHLVTPKFRSPTACREIRVNMAETGNYTITNAASLSTELLEFLTVCLKYDHTQRPEVTDLKTLRFFTPIDWTELSACRVEPPFKIDEIRIPQAKLFAFDVSNEYVLSTAFKPDKPILQGPEEITDVSRLKFVPTDFSTLTKFGFTKERQEILFKHFQFVHPSCKKASTSRKQ